jgi:2-alkyl-3-oxoalkanoate reductase
MRVAITGARGFIGSAVTRFLLAADWDVIPMDIRTGGDPARTCGVPITAWDIASGPLPDPPAVDAVIHAAAYVSDTGPVRLARAVNVGGTQNVAASFPDAMFVHISSGSVYDPHRPQRNASEDEAPAPEAVRWSNSYGLTKSEAEARLRLLRPDAVVLRPHAVYGPGDTTLMPRLREAAQRGSIPLPGGGVQMHSITQVLNLARACQLACLPGAPAGTYNINDGDPVPLRFIVSKLSANSGPPLRIRTVPAPVLLGVAAVLQASAAVRGALSGRQIHPRLSRYVVQHAALERSFDTTAARERLGFAPVPSTLEAALDW